MPAPYHKWVQGGHSAIHKGRGKSLHCSDKEMPCCQELERKSTTVCLIDGGHEWMAASLHVTWFRASAPRQTRTALFWAITQIVMVIPYRRFGTTYRSHLQGSRVQETLKMGKVSWPEKSVRNYQYSLRKSPEHSSSHLIRTLFAREVSTTACCRK